MENNEVLDQIKELLSKDNLKNLIKEVMSENGPPEVVESKKVERPKHNLGQKGQKLFTQEEVVVDIKESEILDKISVDESTRATTRPGIEKVKRHCTQCGQDFTITQGSPLDIKPFICNSCMR